LERLGLADAIEHLWKPIRHAYLLVVVMIGWVFFRADSLPAAVEFLKALAGGRAVTPTPYALQWYLTPELWLALVAGAIGSMPIVPALAKWRDGLSGLEAGRDFVPRLSAIGATALVLLLVASIMQIAARSYNPFIYFRF
jgi:alginate O-acetyltransferase complex protein AlgI